MNIDPKLIEVSKCGKYVYPVDSITGAKTFAPIDYFKNKVATKYGGDLKRFIAEYTTRETKKYLKEGWSPEQLREVVKLKGKLPKLDKNPKKDPNAPKKKKRNRLSAHAESSETVIMADGTKETIRVYPWGTDPVNYFRSPHKPLNVSETTKDACLRPDLYLDEDCYGCNFYDECTCKLKNLKLKTK